MRVNPAGDWKKRDVEALCDQIGLTCKNPKRGSHFKVVSNLLGYILTIPTARPIKACYIRQLVRMAIEQLAAVQHRRDK